MKVFVIYDSKYGNTKLVAEQILDGIKEGGDFETAISYMKDVDFKKLADYNAIVIGMPNHMGRPSRTAKNFVDKLPESNLKAKQAVVFGTYSGKVREDRAVRKMEQMVEKKLPYLKLILPGLSVRVNGIPGPVAEGELPKSKEFGRKIASQLKTQA